MRIDQNVSLSISRQMRQSQSRISQALERLSTGLRVNRPQDDVAAFSTAERLKSQVRGMAQVSLGLNQVRGLLETSTAALSSQVEIIQKMKDISVQASSSLLSSSERASLTQELVGLREEFSRITQDSDFAGIKLLNGSESGLSFLADARGTSIDLQLSDQNLDQVFRKTVGTGNFAAPKSVDAGSGTFYTELKDLNGNGTLDLVSINRSAGTVSVMLGRGDGSFESRTTYSVGTLPGSLALGDVNGNGIVDLIVTNETSNSVSVLLGQGDGSFGPQMTFAVGNAPYEIQLGDFDGDGNIDLVVSNRSSNTLSILLGNGDGSFEAQSTISVGTSPRGLRVGDFNGNGILDLVVASGTNSISVLLGDGSGSFTSSSTLTGGGLNDPRELQVADLTGNGVLDLVVSNRSGNTISIFRGNGSGGFTFASTRTSGSEPGQIRVGDINGNGIADLIVQNGNSDFLSVFLGTGNANFATQSTFSVTDPGSIALGDLNGNGVLDLVAGGDNMRVLLANTKSVAAVSDLNVNTAEKAQKLTSILEEALQKVISAQSSAAVQLTRVDLIEDATLLQRENLEEGLSNLISADFALETSELVAAQILQQAQIASLVQANSQMQVVLGLLGVN